MAKYNVHGGHNKIVPGAAGYLNEVTEDRKVKNAVIKYLRAAGHTAYDCTDDAGTTQGKNLANIVAKCNSHGVDLDVSIHLNSGRGDSKGDGKTGGVEVLIYSTSVKGVAKDIADEIADTFGYGLRTDETTPSGYAGVKIKKNLYVLKNTKAKALLIECCFVDDKDDAKVWNADRCAKAIVRAITGKAASGGSTTSGSTSSGSGNKTTSTSSTPFYKVGNTYTLQSNMVVRTGAGTNYRAKKHSELTADGQKHDKDKNGCLDKGTRITCQQVKKSGSNIWIKCPSGWIAAYYNKKTYVK